MKNRSQGAGDPAGTSSGGFIQTFPGKMLGFIGACACAAVFVVSLVFGIIGITRAAGTSNVEAENGVVLVYAVAQDSYGDLVGGYGSGWFVGTPGKDVQYVVTNGHVVQTLYEGGLKTADVYFSAASNDYTSAEIIYYSAPDEKDIAILKLPTPTDKRSALVIRSSDTVTPGTVAYAIGYPGDSSTLSLMRYDASDLTMTQGIVSKQTTSYYNNAQAFEMDARISGGNSGGPLVDEKGYCIGMNTFGLVNPDTGQSQDLNYAICSNEITAALNSAGIDYTMRGDYNWMIFVFLPLALVALVWPILALIMTKRHKNSTAVATAPASAVATPAAATPVASAPIATPVSSAPVATAASTASAAIPRTTAVAGGMAKASIVGTAGHFTGQSFALQAGVALLIGRDPAKCAVAFPLDTSGVSGVHCSVTWDGTSFTIADLGSSYGTFVGGQKLTGVPVIANAGAVLSLGSDKNAFRLEIG